jgi:mannosyltransferase OCH1-like enzyme
MRGSACSRQILFLLNYNNTRMESMIPKILHQIWYQGTPQIPRKYATNTQRLLTLNPGWKHMVWDAESLRNECRSLGPNIEQAFLAFPHMHQKIDFGRYVVVYTRGGVTVDMDAMPLRSFDVLYPSLHPEKLSVSKLPLKPLEAMTMNVSPFLPTQLNNATLIARPGNPAVAELIGVTAQRATSLLNTVPMVPLTVAVQFTTGPAFFTRILTPLVAANKVDVLDSEILEPCIGYDAMCRPGPRALLDHRHEGSWTSENVRGLLSAYYSLRSFHSSAILVFIVVVVILGSLLARRHITKLNVIL